LSNLSFVKESLMADLLADLRYSLRLLCRSPLFALVTIGTLALGIGTTAAMFSIVDGVCCEVSELDTDGR